MSHLNIVLNQEEMVIIKKIKKMYGITSIAQAFRFALNYTAQSIDAPVTNSNITNDNNDIIISLQRQNEKLQDDLSKSVENERKLYNMLYNIPSTAPVGKKVSQTDTKPVKAADIPQKPVTATVTDIPVAPAPVPTPTPVVQAKQEPVVTDNIPVSTQNSKDDDLIKYYESSPGLRAMLDDAFGDINDDSWNV